MMAGAVGTRWPTGSWRREWVPTPGRSFRKCLRLSVPTLVFVGSEDAFTTRQDADRMHELVRDSSLVWIDGIGHMPNLESPEVFNASLVRFLDRVQPTGMKA